MHHPSDRITHTMAFVRPVVEHWLQREIAQSVERQDTLRSVSRLTVTSLWTAMLDYLMGIFCRSFRITLVFFTSGYEHLKPVFNNFMPFLKLNIITT